MNIEMSFLGSVSRGWLVDWMGRWKLPSFLTKEVEWQFHIKGNGRKVI